MTDELDIIDRPIPELPTEDLMVDDLKEIHERLSKISPAPWYPDEDPDHEDDGYLIWCGRYSDETVIICGSGSKHWPLMKDEAEFIAKCRTDIPNLLAHIEKIQERLDVLDKNYLSAVHGRREMRKGLRECRDKVKALMPIAQAYATEYPDDPKSVAFRKAHKEAE